MIYTRNGDDGQTTLHGVRISKASLQCELLGSLDELNVLMGLCALKARAHDLTIGSELLVSALCEDVQHVLFTLQALTAGYDQPIDSSVVKRIENYIAVIENNNAMPTHFVLAGGTELSAFFDYVRTVVRRVERVYVHHVGLSHEPKHGCAIMFLNRLSSLMYVVARYINVQAAKTEIKPDYSKSTAF